jgi:predicted nucleotide-binding protein
MKSGTHEMNRPAIFVGSSGEGLPVAAAIRQNLKDMTDVYVWTQGVFELAQSHRGSLI